jgi:hypothetical protein
MALWLDGFMVGWLYGWMVERFLPLLRLFIDVRSWVRVMGFMCKGQGNKDG